MHAVINFGIETDIHVVFLVVLGESGHSSIDTQGELTHHGKTCQIAAKQLIILDITWPILKMIRRSKNLNPYPVVIDEKKQEANSGEFDRRETDLLQAYEHVVNCLIGCESTIKDLERQLAAKDEELASKDKAIADLEDKVVQASLELALTRAREDELMNELQHGLEARFDSLRYKGEDDAQARHQPISTSSRKKAKVGGGPGSHSEPDPGDEELSLDGGSETGFDDSITSRLANFRKHFLKSLSDERVEAQPTSARLTARK